MKGRPHNDSRYSDCCTCITSASYTYCTSSPMGVVLANIMPAHTPSITDTEGVTVPPTPCLMNESRTLVWSPIAPPPSMPVSLLLYKVTVTPSIRSAGVRLALEVYMVALRVMLEVGAGKHVMDSLPHCLHILSALYSYSMLVPGGIVSPPLMQKAVTGVRRSG